MLYRLPIIFGTVSSALTLFLTFILFMKEYKTISFKKLEHNHEERTYLELVIFSTVHLFLMFGYFLLTYLWTGLLLCCSDHDKPSFNFSVWRVGFLFTGVGVNCYIFYKLLTTKIIINHEATVIGWILVMNMLLIIFVTSVNKCCKICKSDNKKIKESKYEELE